MMFVLTITSKCNQTLRVPLRWRGGKGDSFVTFYVGVTVVVHGCEFCDLNVVQI